MMKQTISGINYSNYSYKIESLNENNNHYFQILCRHKKSKRKSSITNLNYILSDIVSVVMDEMRIEDSWIKTNKKRADKLFSVAMECFEDKFGTERIECKLDEDRRCGEWEAHFKF